MKFYSYDRTVKRWYSKVIPLACKKISKVINDNGIDSLGEFAAEFDLSTNAVPTVIRKFNSKHEFVIIRFATENWTSVNTSIEDAANQLASALVVYSRHPKLGDIFKTAGFSLSHAIYRRERMKDDPNDHAIAWISNELTPEEFFSIVDSLETILEKSKVGIVTGTGWGLNGWNIDLASESIDQCISIASEELESNKLEFSISKA